MEKRDELKLLLLEPPSGESSPKYDEILRESEMAAFNRAKQQIG